MPNITDIEHSLDGDITIEYSDKSVTTGKGLFLDGDIIKSLDNTKIFNTSNYISKDPTTNLITDPVQRAAVVEVTAIALAQSLDALIYGTVTRDVNGAAVSANVAWPDGATGVYTATSVSTAFPGAVDAYTVTHVLNGVTTTYTQPAVTRDSTGAVTNKPTMTEA